jgi:glycosyltransferase involved in cell wall biosynthesis
MNKLTAIIIAKNEEEMIADCLESVRFADLMIVIDNGSTDRTAAIAKEKGAKVYHVDLADFSELRDYGLKKAPAGYILYLDADERVTDALQDEVQAILFQDKPAFAAYRIPRKNFYLGNNAWPTTEKLERLFVRRYLKGWKGKLHETAVVTGEIGELEHPMLHYTHRDLSSMVSKTNTWSEIEARLRLDASHPPMTWWRFPRVILSAFVGSYIKQEGWKAGTMGLIESLYQGFSMFITYAKLWELQQERKRK